MRSAEGMALFLLKRRSKLHQQPFLYIPHNSLPIHLPQLQVGSFLYNKFLSKTCSCIATVSQPSLKCLYCVIRVFFPPLLLCSLVTIFFFLFFLQLHPRHMDIPRLGVESKLQPPAYITATSNARSEQHLQATSRLRAMPDP